MSIRLLTEGSVRLLVALGCAGALAAGCTAPGPGPAGTQFDGSYQGENRVVRGFGFVCEPPSYQDAVTVKDGRFDYAFVDSLARPAPIPVRIAADGTFSGQIQYGTDSTSRWAQMIVVWAMVRGRINGTALQATVTDYRCTRDLTLQQR
jgi:hypothetical protein